MHKITSRVLAFLLCLTLMLGNIAPAFAADTDQEIDTETITQPQKDADSDNKEKRTSPEVLEEVKKETTDDDNEEEIIDDESDEETVGDKKVEEIGEEEVEETTNDDGEEETDDEEEIEEDADDKASEEVTDDEDDEAGLMLLSEEEEPEVNLVPASYPAAPVAEQEVSGMYVRKVGSTDVYSMFRVAQATAIKVDGKIYATIYVSPASSGNFTYAYMHFGTRAGLTAQLEEGGNISVIPGAISGGYQAFHIAVADTNENSAIPVCILKSDLNAKSPYNSNELELVIPSDIPEGQVKKDPVPTPASYPAAPADEQAVEGMYVHKAGATDNYAMFKIETAAAIKADGKIYATVYVNPASSGSFTYSYLYFGTRTALLDQLDKGGAFSVVAGSVVNGKQAYHFTLPESAENTSIPVCILKSDLNAKSPYNSNDLELSVPVIPDISEPEPDVPAPAPDMPSLEGLQEANIQVVKESDGTVFKMFTFSKTNMVEYGTEKLLIHLETANTSFDKIYFGPSGDSSKSGYAAGSKLASGGWSFDCELPYSAKGTTFPVTLGKPDGSWYTNNNLLMTVPAAENPDIVTPEPEPTDPAEIPEGIYNTTAETGAAMFKVVKAQLINQDGKLSAVLTLSGTGYDYLYVGTKEQAAADPDNRIPYASVTCTLNGETKEYYTYTIPVEDVSSPIAIASHSAAKDLWYDRSVTISTEKLNKTAVDGSYSVETSCDASMFRIVDAKLNIVNGEMTAVLTLSGTGYDYLYAGTGEQASADKDHWIPFQTDADGKYTYTVPVSALDQVLTISSHSQKNNLWYDRSVTFLAESLKLLGDAEQPDPTPEDTEKDDTTPDEESKNEADTDGATSAVDNSTKLADGVYTPDKFSFSGGTGKVRITCSKVTVRDGKAYATLNFSSSAYVYVKASGNTYYATANGSGTSFTIPIALNRNNRIIGMTTKMTTAHEIEYSIFVALDDGAVAEETASEALDETAPTIPGLTFEKEIPLKNAKLLKIYAYQDGITLVEIDNGTDSALADKELSAAASDEILTASESVAQLYKAKIQKYLIVPEDCELPAGLDKEYIVIRKPISSVCVSSEEALEILAQLGKLDVISVLSVETADETLTQGLESGAVVSGGSYNDPDYKALVQKKVDLVLASEKLIAADEDLEAFNTITDRCATLGISLVVDRSASEEDPLGRAEWLHLYGILFDMEDAAQALIESAK